MSMGKLTTFFYAAFLLAGCGYVSTPSAVHSDSDDGSTDEETSDPGPDPDIQTDDFIAEDEAEPECGNFIIETGEECDDGKNGDPRDGCTDSCKLSCFDDAACQNTNECDGEDYCNLETCECKHRNAPADGTACTDDTLSCTVDVCAAGICAHNPASGSCAIGGACYSDGESNPLNGCQVCQSAVNPMSWTLQFVQKLESDVRITNTDDDSQAPSVVWTGSEFGVAWIDTNFIDLSTALRYFARIDSTGSKIGGDVRITNDSRWGLSISLAWTGSEFGLAFDVSESGIYFTRISSSGSKIGGDVRITNETGDMCDHSLVWTGSEFGIAWPDYRDGDNSEIYFARIDSSGSKIGSDVRITNASDISWHPSLAWTGSEFGVAWSDLRDYDYEIYFARIDSSGSKIGSDVRMSNIIGTSLGPSLAWIGSEFGVAWSDEYEIYFARIDSSGLKIGSDVMITDGLGHASPPSFIWTGAEFGMVWSYTIGIDYDVYFARIDSSGSKIGSDVWITNTPDYYSGNPSMAWTGSEFGVVWEDLRDGNVEIYFARMGCSP